MELVEYTQKFQPLIENYYLADLTYTGSPQKAVKLSETNTNYRPILGLNQNHLVTFFVLDYGKDKLKYTQNTESLLLRSFSTDSRYTGRGFAKTALQLMNKFVKDNYPDIHEIILGVNERNTPAINLYTQAGFVDTDSRYIGKKGPQIVMQMELL